MISPKLCVPLFTILALASDAKTPEAMDVLLKVARTYENLAAYDVEIVNVYQLHASAGSEFRYHLAAEKPDRFLYAISMPGFNQQVVGDGMSVFWYKSRLNEYRQEIYRREPELPVRETDGAAVFLKMHTEFIERFTLLARRAQRKPQYKGRSTVRTADGIVDAIVIRAQSENQTPLKRWVETLWIHPEWFVVLRSRAYGLQRLGNSKTAAEVTRTDDYVWNAILPPLRDETFSFTPPRGAKLVEKFSVRP